MVLEKLSSSLKNTLSKIAKAIFIDESLIDELVKDIQRALLQADVNVQMVLNISKTIKERALKEKPPKSISQKEYLIKIVYEELVKFLGREESEIKILKKKPFKVVMVGLYGSGKTTTIGKIANYYQKRNYKVATLGLDVHRPAAPKQLKQISDQIKVKCFIDEKEKDPIKIYKTFEKEFKNYDLLIVDTAGRDALSQDLIKEIESLHKKIEPDENLLVISADIGQAAFDQAKKFHEVGTITGVIISKMDGTARGGGALVAAAATGAHIKFIGVGEKINDLERFDPQGFVSRLLGMGDIKALLEKAEEAIDLEKAEDLGKKFIKGDFNLIDLYEQMQAMSKMGPLSKVMDLIPGMGKLKLPKGMIEVQESKLKRWRYILNSMTKKELEDPNIINSDRINRISKGAGVTSKEVRELLKQYKHVKKLTKMLKGKDPEKLMKKLGGKLPPNLGM